jgi:YVTN family beta-propeller protein
VRRSPSAAVGSARRCCRQPNGKTVYVVNNGSGTVTLISTTTNTAGQAINVGLAPVSIAITP